MISHNRRKTSTISIYASVLLSVMMLTLLISCCFSIPGALTLSSYSGNAKSMAFYFHYFDTPAAVAGIETKYVMNTTRDFRFLTNAEAYTNSFYKPEGLPKIVVDFYLYPNFASPVTINGSWQVFLWVNSSAYKPVTFALQFREITLGGVELWDSGQITPTVTSSIGSYLDVPLYNYNLSTPLAHTFQADTTLHVSIEVNAGAAADTRIWYDSPYYPSKLLLPATDYARPLDVTTHTVDGAETTLFYYNWSQPERTVVIRANVTDPFGGYDIHSVNMTLKDPTNTPVLENIAMQRISEDPLTSYYAHTFEANWSYPSTVTLGNYTIVVTVVDNNGFYRMLDVGDASPFSESFTHIFTIGELTYYDPALLVVDSEGDPLANAQIYVTWPNGSRDLLPRYTDRNGFLNLTHLLPANYGVTVSWKDTIVNQTQLYVESVGPYTIIAQVYHLTVLVTDNGGTPLSGVYVMATTPAGVGYGLGITDSSGHAVFILPMGVYSLEAHYSTSYMLTAVSTQATQTPVLVEQSTTATIQLTDFPPALLATTGFLLVIVVLLVGAAGLLYLAYHKGLLRR